VNEGQLQALLDAHDSLVVRCVGGDLSFTDFARLYADFPLRYALDGHEDGPVSRQLLAKYAARVRFHLDVIGALSNVCSDEDFANPAYARAGRFPPSTAVERLRALIAKQGMGSTQLQRDV